MSPWCGHEWPESPGGAERGPAPPALPSWPRGLLAVPGVLAVPGLSALPPFPCCPLSPARGGRGAAWALCGCCVGAALPVACADVLPEDTGVHAQLLISVKPCANKCLEQLIGSGVLCDPVFLSPAVWPHRSQRARAALTELLFPAGLGRAARRSLAHLNAWFPGTLYFQTRKPSLCDE